MVAHRDRRCGVTFLFATLLYGAPAIAAVGPARLADLSFEELSNIVVTSVSKRAERLSDVPKSVFVITADDIRRSGATSLPEALRLAPNLQVARANANDYAISARGFNGPSANKLLVLIDGRSVYTPLYAGVFWDVQDVMLEDIERIEVISGPGSTLWGVNAVNGVINVITRSAQDTQGKLISAGGGNREASVAARVGNTFGSDGHYRLYAKHVARRHTTTASGEEVDDASRMSQAGFRADWRHASDQLSVQGNVYNGEHGHPQPGTIVLNGVNFSLGDIPLSGVNLIARWDHSLENDSTLTLQAHYDRTERDVRTVFSETLDMVDLQFQYSMRPLDGHTLVWGGQYRYGTDRVRNDTAFFAFLPGHVRQEWSSLFAQDEIPLTEELRLTLGARVERNDYTGSEFLPNARLAWKLAADHLVWGGAAHTVRAPSRLDRDAFAFVPFPQPPYQEIRLIGGPQFRAETADVYEVGYRGQPTADTSYSLTVFKASYDHLRTQELELAPPLALFSFANGMEGSTRGVEMWGKYQVSPAWRLWAGYSRLRERFRLKPGSGDSAGLASVAGQDPEQSWMLRSSHDLPGQSELDVAVRHVSALSMPAVGGYLALDARYSWRPSPNLELSLSGKNLLGTQHGEFAALATRTELGSSVFFNVVSRF